MITIAELFPFFSTAYKWLGVFRASCGQPSLGETVRLEKEYTIYSISSSKDGYFVEHYMVDMNLHRRDGPAEIMHKYGLVLWEHYKMNGVLHREDGPARIVFSDLNGNVKFEEWWLHGKYKRIDQDKPTFTSYHVNGKNFIKVWTKNGFLHRTDGPARIQYREDGSFASLEYWIDGKKQ